jgi:type IV fimbrial biogenesis protein FimT
MIAVALLSILLLLGMPAFGTYLQNAKLRSAAENFYAGVQLARAEAVRRNAAVQIALTTDFPDSGAANTGNLSTTAPNWIVRVQDPATLLYDFIEGKAGTEGAGQAAGSDSSVQITGTVSSITFNGFGRASTAATVAVTSPSGGACAPAGPMRCLNIVVSLGGQARLCDPGVNPATGDTRAC